MEKLKLGSLFDGSGGFPLAGLISDITPVWASEIEPFPIRVTTKRLPWVKHYGNICDMNGAEIEPVDIITFGSPCQDLSIAGKRKGLQDGERSNLFFQAVRIIKEMREATNGKYPTYIIWENVCGAFSSNDGEDFRCVLESIMRIKNPEISIPGSKKWENSGLIVDESVSVAWRLFDAQFWGVPQRRRRIYLVADFGGCNAGQILFESESLLGYFKQGKTEGEGTSDSSEKSFGTTGFQYNGLGKSLDQVLCLNDQGGVRMDVTLDKVNTLRAESHHPPIVLDKPYCAGFCTEHSAKAHSIGYEENVAPTLRAGTVPATIYDWHRQDTRITVCNKIACTVSASYGLGGNNQPMVCEEINKEHTDVSRETECEKPLVYGLCAKDSNSMKSSNPNSGFYLAGTTRTLDQNAGSPTCNQGGMVVLEGCGSRPSHHGDGYIESEVMYTLNTVERHAVAFSEVHGTLSANDGPKGPSSQMLSNPCENFVAAPVYTTSKNSYHTEASENVANTLVATDYKDPPIVTETPYYKVRRLIPMECARLQGFPDWWCSNLETENPTEEEMDFWRKTFETHRKIVKDSSKPKSDAQIRKWLANPHSDSAEYKMWGNGIALPCAVYILSGISYFNKCR